MSGLIGAVLIGLSTGCVRVYQPLSGLHRPVIVDPQAPNLADVRLTVHCIPGGLLTQADAGLLCDRVTTLFENQGATVRAIDTVGIADDGLQDRPAPDEQAPEPRTDLLLELRARRVHQSNHPISWALCAVSFTILPGLTELSFAQDVTIRDGSGFLLVSDTLEGRVMTRFGAGTWVGNKLMDALVREKEDRIASDTAEQDLSADFYGQLSQLTFNARVHRDVLAGQGPTSP